MAQRFSIKHTDSDGNVSYLYCEDGRDHEILSDDEPASYLPADVYKLEEVLAWWKEGVRLGQLHDPSDLLPTAVVGVVE